jgi:predicted membrane-bound mannosyltransferase/DNA-binding beta-propeller fold protein YncE
MDDQKRNWLDRPLFESVPFLTVEVALFCLIVLLAVISRFYDLGLRVMSHDENSHVYFEAWRLFQGNGYQHDPMMHGPLMVHFMALSYFLFGANDFTSRIPMALAGILTIGMVWYWRRYLGKPGALAAAFLLLISPYALFYARYARQEATLVLFGLLMLYAVLRYLETSEPRFIYLFTGVLALHYTEKATAFIYTAEIFVYLAILFIVRVTRRRWADERNYRAFLIALLVGILFIGSAAGLGLYTRQQGTLSATETAAPINPTAPPAVAAVTGAFSPPLALGAVGIVAFVAAFYFLLRGYTIHRLLKEPTFNLMILIFTLVLPQAAALPSRMVGWNPLDYSTSGIGHTATFLVPMAIVAIAVGLWWNPEVWLKSTLLFYGIFTLFYTTFFTNGLGFFSGLVGSLGYWLSQQAVQRGSQPWYYYIAVQIPIYEFLPALASILAVIFGLTRRRPAATSGASEPDPDVLQADENYFNTFTLLVLWSVTSLVGFSYAGEKMPWLTVHISLPLSLLGGWGIGQLIERVDWADLKRHRPALSVVVAVLFVISTAFAIGYALGSPPPFQGKELDQLQITSSFLLALVTALVSGWGLFRLLRDWRPRQVFQILALIFFGILAVQTIRTSLRANYVLYDSGEEYLVYAHAYTGVKDVMKQVEEISRRTSGGLNIEVAYDDDVSPSFSWYLRNYPNARFYGSEPGRDLRGVPVIIVGDNNFSKIEPVVADQYYRFDYIRMVWPNQDYFGLTWERIRNALTDPALRAAIFEVWLNRDYTKYAEVTGEANLTQADWSPSDRMRMYVRKDLAAEIWDYGAVPVAAPEEDPYKDGAIQLEADAVFGAAGTEPGQLNAPRGLATAPDGSLYVADSRNHRIQHFASDGKLIEAWGTFADASKQDAPAGTFNEPWGVAVGPDGAVYVSDTWNHRIQKFSADGQPLAMWGQYGGSESTDTFWGPRGIAVDSGGQVYVADTGNKRILVFDSDGNYITQFGGPGLEPGQFDEPVGIAVDGQGDVYVTDTWNQRVQVFAPGADGLSYIPLLQWAINGWYGQSVDNKPFIAVDEARRVFVSDPDGYRIIEFDGTSGAFLQLWGDIGDDPASFRLPSGVALDSQGRLWASDSGNNRLMRFTPPAK